MSRSNRWARSKRDELYLLLGGSCMGCGAHRELQFDHVIPCGWVPNLHSWSERMIEYRRAHAAGNLQLLCASCHAKKSRSRQDEFAVPEDMQPY